MNEAYIQTRELRFHYDLGEESIQALDGVSLTVPEGAHLAILGRNGSGKSTLAKLISSLELPESGEVRVAGIQPLDEESIWELRRICAMVFQNPDNQIIGTTVEEDIAFGPENLGIPTERIRFRVDQCARMVGLEHVLTKAPSSLSGGQKQKLAIAGVLAMEPRILILDEATSMLDPLTRKELLALVTELGQKYKLTILNITHHMDEALRADLVAVMEEGRILFTGTPEEIFAQSEMIQAIGLDVPVHTAIATRFYRACAEPLKGDRVVTAGGARDAVLELLDKRAAQSAEERAKAFYTPPEEHLAPEEEKVIEVEGLGYEYPSFGEQSHPALTNVSFSVRRGEIFGIMGHTGSGKSTLIRHLNGLLRPQTGTVRVLGEATDKNTGVREIRRHVGLLFQYPEHQLFAETIEEDVSYGPTKLGWEPDIVKLAVREAVQRVGLDEELLSRSPFELSGGQKRRVALAGILAMRPEVLVLDEPAAALDPSGRERMLELVQELRDAGVTIILVSHSMEDLARICDRILVLYEGQVVRCGTPTEVFSDTEEALAACSLTYPAPMAFLHSLREQRPELPELCFSIGQAVRALLRVGGDAERRAV